jgi:tryptophanyl-tRNA synthetase
MAQRTSQRCAVLRRLHLGNYYGAIREFVRLQHEGEALYFIANYHALNTVRDPVLARQLTFETALRVPGAGPRPEQARHAVSAERHSRGDRAVAGSSAPSMPMPEPRARTQLQATRWLRASPKFGLFAYPVLMAADILLYDSDVVPVGAIRSSTSS